MKKTLLLVTVLGIIASCSKKEKDYTNENYAISFDLAENWQVESDSINHVLYIMSPSKEGDEFQEMVNVVVGKTNGLSFQDFFDKNLSAVEGMFEELTQTEKPSVVTINNKQFKKVKYNYVFQGYSLTANLFVTLSGEKSYVINCSALQHTFDDYETDFNSIINSIEIN